MRPRRDREWRVGEPRAEPIAIALVNNMSDQALAPTVAQFSRLIEAGAGDTAYRLHCYALPSIERSDTARRFLRQSHEDVEALYAHGADALIVTGAEPRAASLTDEPFWPDLERLVDWARDHTISTIWSCLASHAAVLSLEGVERRRLPEKLSGVYSFEATPEDWAARGAGPRVLAPHSRYNELPRDQLERRGYRISTASSCAGVDAFWRREPSLFLYLQGHPEYDADSLAKEYRRDVLRFCGGARAAYPNIPDGVFLEETAAKLQEFRRAVCARDDLASARRLDDILGSQRLSADWSEDAARLYRNWLDIVASEKRALRRSA